MSRPSDTWPGMAEEWAEYQERRKADAKRRYAEYLAEQRRLAAIRVAEAKADFKRERHDEWQSTVGHGTDPFAGARLISQYELGRLMQPEPEDENDFDVLALLRWGD